MKLPCRKRIRLFLSRLAQSNYKIHEKSSTNRFIILFFMKTYLFEHDVKTNGVAMQFKIEQQPSATIMDFVLFGVNVIYVSFVFFFFFCKPVKSSRN